MAFPPFGRKYCKIREDFECLCRTSKDAMHGNYTDILQRLDVLLETDSDQEGALLSTSSSKGEPQSLVIVQHGFVPPQAWILADGVSVKYIEDDQLVFNFIYDLMACYYTWDLTYPKQYQILGFLQSHMLNDHDFTFYKSAKYMVFDKKYCELDC